jgi:uncharacterized repeat protein (TIGR03803 family)
MRTTFTLLAGLTLVLTVVATSLANPFPAISQVFAFSCNSDYSSCPDGMDPTLAPIQLADGNFYGVTWWAGQGNSNAGGTVGKVTPAGKATVVHTFMPNKAGQYPRGENPVIGFCRGRGPQPLRRNRIGRQLESGSDVQAVTYWRIQGGA